MLDTGQRYDDIGRINKDFGDAGGLRSDRHEIEDAVPAVERHGVAGGRISSIDADWLIAGDSGWTGGAVAGQTGGNGRGIKIDMIAARAAIDDEARLVGEGNRLLVINADLRRLDAKLPVLNGLDGSQATRGAAEAHAAASADRDAEV